MKYDYYIFKVPGTPEKTLNMKDSTLSFSSAQYREGSGITVDISLNINNSLCSSLEWPMVNLWHKGHILQQTLLFPLTLLHEARKESSSLR